MKRLLISGWDGRMGGRVRALAPAYGFDPLDFDGNDAGDIVIDFSHPSRLQALLERSLPLVIGTTGVTPAQQAQIAAAAQAFPIFHSANFSPGIFALSRALRQLKTLLPEWEAALTEQHHAAKRDVPSGTALELAKVLGLPEDQILSGRAGTVRGVHTVVLYGPEETLTLTHSAESRTLFAHGALRAAQWLLTQKNGLYGMENLYRP